MADSRYKIVKDGWGSRPNFQASHGLGMTPEGLAEGDKILDAMQRADAGASKKNDVEKEPESAWVKKNRERYEAGGRSALKEAAARQLAEEYDFTPTGDPEMDMMIAIGLRDMKDGPEFSHMVESGESISSSSNLGGSAAAGEVIGGTKSKRQLKRERQRERARLHNLGYKV